MLRYIPSILTLLTVFIMNVEFCWMLLLPLLRWSCSFPHHSLTWLPLHSYLSVSSDKMQVLGEQGWSDLFLEPRTMSGTQQAFSRCLLNKCRGYNGGCRGRKVLCHRSDFFNVTVRNIQVKGEVTSAILDCMLTLTKVKPLKTVPKWENT